MRKWMTYLASISVKLEETLDDNGGSASDHVIILISILVLVKTLPNTPLFEDQYTDGKSELLSK
jgi:hypothetical protein